MTLKIPRLRIPVFVSCPWGLNKRQEKQAKLILELLERNKLQWRALGQSDYPRNLPLGEVVGMIRHCSGGLVLGFEQYWVRSGTYRRGVRRPPAKGGQRKLKPNTLLPTPWNQLEAGIIFSHALPLMILKEPEIEGGVFDLGITDVFAHEIPSPGMPKAAFDDFDSVFQRWVAEVKIRYHRK
jgi:hypothetical protein